MMKDTNGVPFTTVDGKPPVTPNQSVTILKNGRRIRGWMNGNLAVESE